LSFGTLGCNFRCPFCHNVDLIPAEPEKGWTVTPEEIINCLKHRQGQLDGVVITGGEPCIQKDLEDFCAALRTMGFMIKIDTNGSRPDIIRKLLRQELVDFFAMDIKAPADSYRRLAGVEIPAETITESIAVIASSGIPHIFRTTLVKPLLSEDDTIRIVRMVPAGSSHVFQEFRSDRILCPDILQEER